MKTFSVAKEVTIDGQPCTITAYVYANTREEVADAIAKSFISCKEVADAIAKSFISCEVSPGNSDTSVAYQTLRGRCESAERDLRELRDKYTEKCAESSQLAVAGLDAATEAKKYKDLHATVSLMLKNTDDELEKERRKWKGNESTAVAELQARDEYQNRRIRDLESHITDLKNKLVAQEVSPGNSGETLTERSAWQQKEIKRLNGEVTRLDRDSAGFATETKKYKDLHANVCLMLKSAQDVLEKERIGASQRIDELEGKLLSVYNAVYYPADTTNGLSAAYALTESDILFIRNHAKKFAEMDKDLDDARAEGRKHCKLATDLSIQLGAVHAACLRSPTTVSGIPKKLHEDDVGYSEEQNLVIDLREELDKYHRLGMTPTHIRTALDQKNGQIRDLETNVVKLKGWLDDREAALRAIKNSFSPHATNVQLHRSDYGYSEAYPLVLAMQEELKALKAAKPTPPGLLPVLRWAVNDDLDALSLSEGSPLLFIYVNDAAHLLSIESQRNPARTYSLVPMYFKDEATAEHWRATYKAP